MHDSIFKLTITLAAILVLSLSAQADLFKLTSGGQIEGELVNLRENPRISYVVKTEAGQITLPRATVKQVIEKSAAEKDYEAILPQLKNTIEDHLKMVEWCRANRVEEKRVLHLQEVIRLDPDHEKARDALGYTQHRGQWIIRDEWMKQQGYVRFRGRWMFNEDVVMLQRLELIKEQEITWRKRLKTWLSNLRKGGSRSLEAQKEIPRIKDPLAGKILIELVEKEKNEKVKVLLIEALSNLEIGSVTFTLAKLAMGDPYASVRDQATIALENRDNRIAVGYLVQQLRSPLNSTVNRSAVVLGRLKPVAATVPLMDALVTSHKYQVTQGGIPGQTSAGFGNDGSGGMTFGTPKAKIITQAHQNDAVLSALLNVVESEVNFRFDESSWKLWHANKKVPLDVDLRRNE
ncbi:MAG: hypothetical protein COA78_04495 [Blastopirellula sp.]|nr:MAG: hypothetical protein COA78_04495 [Blastopirellula sp.]